MTTTNSVPSDDVSDFLFNAEKIDEAVNGSLLTYADRLGVNRLTLAGATARISAVNPRGPWATATLYQPRDLVLESGTWYIALDTHTSGATFSGDKSAHWRVYQGVISSDLTAALTNLGIIDLNATVTVNAAVTLPGSTIAHCVLITDSGSPADYTVTLPAGAAVGSLIMVRIAGSATKLFTVHGNDVPIDGQTTRVMWAGESALLQREVAGWTKLSGRTRPFVGGIQRLSDQTGVSAATFTQVTFTSAFGDPSGLNLLFNAGTGNLVIKRPGVYRFTGNLAMDGASGTTGASVQLAIVKNSGSPGISPNALVSDIVAGAGPVRMNVTGQFVCAAADAVGLVGYMGAGSGLFFDFTTAVVAPTLTFEEIATW